MIFESKNFEINIQNFLIDLPKRTFTIKLFKNKRIFTIKIPKKNKISCIEINK
jgi:hypothetical protein